MAFHLKEFLPETDEKVENLSVDIDRELFTLHFSDSSQLALRTALSLIDNREVSASLQRSICQVFRIAIFEKISYLHEYDCDNFLPTNFSESFAHSEYTNFQIFMSIGLELWNTLLERYPVSLFGANANGMWEIVFGKNVPYYQENGAWPRNVDENSPCVLYIASLVREEHRSTVLTAGSNMSRVTIYHTIVKLLENGEISLDCEHSRYGF